MMEFAAAWVGTVFELGARRGKIPRLVYIPNVLSLIRGHRSFFVGTVLAALALRLCFFFYFPAVTDDSRIYADLAANWLQHGVYSQTQTGPQGAEIVPTDTRLPGYPAFLVAIFWLFGVGNFRAVMLTQILLDLGTCFVVADLARRLVSERAAKIAFLLAVLCPFLANYASAVLTETLEIFFTALALDCAAAALRQMGGGQSRMGAYKRFAATGVAIATCMLLRPDGGILLAAVLFYLMAATGAGGRSRAPAAIVVTLLAMAPLLPWTLRNFRTLHHFQPLAPRYATETDELVPRGFNRWVKTWMIDYASVEEIYWNVPGEKIDPAKLPSRAFDNPAERDATLALFADYNQSQDVTLDLDTRFGNLAAERIRAHPIRDYAVLPLLRIADMWLRPRTEILPPDVRWWEFNDDAKWSALAVGFGLLNLAYVGTAAWALFRMRPEICWVGLLISFLLLRSAFLGTLENPEPRYTLECYPAILVLASSLLAAKIGSAKPDQRLSQG
jgi:4-amino-4-deoxy-L-arabinose transferase-like glycosyltransferase